MTATLAKGAIGVWMGLALAYVFLRLPAAEGFASPDLARVVALHLPNAYVAVLMAFVAGWFGFRYLARGRSLADDSKSATAAALAALFCLLTTVTGSVFASVQWGSYWNWDPRETSVFLLLLVFAAYFALRAGIEDEEKRASIGAVYILFAAALTPLLGYIIPKLLPSLHPTNAKFDATYRMAIYVCVLPPLLGMAVWLQNIAVRFHRARLAVATVEADRGY